MMAKNDYYNIIIPTEKNTEVPNAQSSSLTRFIQLAKRNNRRFFYWHGKFYHIPEKINYKEDYSSKLEQYKGKHELYYLR